MEKKLLILDADYDIGEENTALLIKELLPGNNVEILRVCENKFPINLDYDGFIITGSAANFDDGKEWISRLVGLIRKIHNNKYLLGICFGHQIIAYALGGEVIHIPKREFGYKEINLTEDGRKDKLFYNFSLPFVCFVSHGDIVTKIPPDSQLLAFNNFGIQAFKIVKTYGIQFHPEITPWLAVAMAKSRTSNLNEIINDSQRFGRPAAKIFENFLRLL